MVRLSLVAGVAALMIALPARPAHGAPAPDCAARTFDVYFEELKTDLTPEARRSLLMQQRSYRGCRIEHVRIVGMADASAPKDRNQALSQNRAKTIADLLVSGGWAREKLELVARGDKGATKGGLDRPLRRKVRVTVEARPA